MAALEALNEAVVDCRRCPRLVEWRERVAREKRAAYRDWDYWGRPMQGFGDPAARDLDSRARARRARRQPDGPDLHRRPLGRLSVRGAVSRRAAPNQAESISRDDGLHAARRLHRRRGPLRAAREPADARGAVELLRVARARGRAAGRGPLGHVSRRLRVGERAAAARRARRCAGAAPEAEVRPRRGRRRRAVAAARVLPPSQQNTFTGKLTPSMMDAVLGQARTLAWGT